MLNVMICDDEKELRIDLKRIIDRSLGLWGVSYSIFEFSSAEALISSYKGNQDQQILFLDIKLDGVSGMDAAEHIRRLDPSAVIIFVTAYSDFVFQGYDVRAFNYILKPYQEEKIVQVLRDALDLLNMSQETCLFIEQRGKTLRLPFARIQYIFSEKHLLHAVAAGETFSFYGKLGDLANTLPDCFVRIHNRYLVNLNHLDALEKNSVRVAQKTLPVSRSYKQALSIAFARYLLR
ncbi:DNA-binding response regulator [Clostridiales bacterium]|nr:DNA-binding response regulator [Clostridiales bacterium]